MTIPRRPLGKTGFLVSEIGFGAWAIGADWGDAVPPDRARRALGAALDAGMNFIDTADIYGAGRSESLIGEVLAQRQRSHPDERIVVATKMGRGPGWNDSPAAIREAALRSCERLGVESLDLVQLHCIDFSLIQNGRVLDSLEQAKSEGIIRHYGLSVETIDEALWAIRHTSVASLQVIFNLFRQRLVEELFPAVREAGVGIVARVPLASGILSGKFKAGQQFAALDHRHFNADGQAFNVGETFAGVPLGQGIGFAQEIASLLAGESPGATLAQKCMRWILDFPEVSTVIPGSKSPAQSQDNAGTSALPALSAEAHAALDRLYRDRIDAAVRGRY